LSQHNKNKNKNKNKQEQQQKQQEMVNAQPGLKLHHQQHMSMALHNGVDGVSKFLQTQRWSRWVRHSWL